MQFHPVPFEAFPQQSSSRRNVREPIAFSRQVPRTVPYPPRFSAELPPGQPPCDRGAFFTQAHSRSLAGPLPAAPLTPLEELASDSLQIILKDDMCPLE